MASNDQLANFVKEALERGVPRAEVESALIRVGWPRTKVQDALAGYADIDFPIPVPVPRPHLSPRDAFVYLVLFTALYLSAYHFGALLFTFIDLALPDAVDGRYVVEYTRGAIHWSVATLLVSFPVLIFLSRISERKANTDPGPHISQVRLWLTYLTLFVAAVVLIGVMIALIYGVLGGDLTLRFVLKASVVGMIAASVFVYYLGESRSDETERRRHLGGRFFRAAVVGFVTASVLGGLVLLGSPQDERLRRLDARRVDDLRQIQWAAELYWSRTGQLPETLAELADTPGVSIGVVDPVSGEMYDYLRLDESRFELCARFAQESAGPGRPTQSFWTHGAGRHCFEFDARSLQRLHLEPGRTLDTLSHHPIRGETHQRVSQRTE